MTSAQLSRNGTMKHEGMPDHASFGVRLPKSIYSDLFYELLILFD